jgi:hypothetical protein
MWLGDAELLIKNKLKEKEINNNSDNINDLPPPVLFVLPCLFIFFLLHFYTKNIFIKKINLRIMNLFQEQHLMRSWKIQVCSR